MRILALETSSEYCSVALWQDGTVVERCELVGQKHSEVLMGMLNKLLRAADTKNFCPGTRVKLAQSPQGGRRGIPNGSAITLAQPPHNKVRQSTILATQGCGVDTGGRRGIPNGSAITLAQLDGIAFGMGPGSFTGVRIACGVTQGLALGANLPVVGVCTLEALAEASGKPRVIAALDARMGEIYHAAYRKQNGTWLTECEPSLCLPQDAPSLPGDDWFGVGSGFAVHGAVLGGRYAGQLLGMDGSLVPQAAAIAALGAAQFALGHGVDAAAALPLYLRDKVALKTSEREKG
jgi:tRNA threonylcarbamoyladenosine biosynthesis protein TsaB